MTSDKLPLIPSDPTQTVLPPTTQPVLPPSTLPWQEHPKVQQSVEASEPKLGVYKVVGPYGLSALVVSLHGSSAIEAVSHDGSSWRAMDVWPDHCSAELLGATNVDSKLWQHFLIEQGLSVTGMVFQ